MNGRMYTTTFNGVAVTATQDFFEITAADDKIIAIHEIRLSQYTDVKDAEEEILSWKIVRGHVTSGSGGTAPVPRPLDPSDTAAGAAVEANNTTIASAGTGVDLESDSFNVRVGLLWLPTPERRPWTTQAIGLICVRLMVAPADSLTMNGSITFEELG